MTSPIDALVRQVAEETARAVEARMVPQEPTLAFKLGDAARVLSISPPTLKKLIDAGKIRTVQVLESRLIARAEIDRFLQGDTNE